MNNVGTNYLQSEYEELLKEPSARELTEAEAKMFINKNYGFEASRIEIHMDAIVADFSKKERHGIPVWTPTALHPRRAIYAAPDHNYIRFDVCGNQYELCNGEMYFYID